MGTDREGKPIEEGQGLLIDWDDEQARWINNWSEQEEDDTFFTTDGEANAFHASVCGARMAFEIRSINRLEYERVKKKHTKFKRGQEIVNNSGLSADMFIAGVVNWEGMLEAKMNGSGEVIRGEDGKPQSVPMRCDEENRRRLAKGRYWLLCACVGGAALDPGLRKDHKDQAEQVKNS